MPFNFWPANRKFILQLKQEGFFSACLDKIVASNIGKIDRVIGPTTKKITGTSERKPENKSEGIGILHQGKHRIPSNIESR
jgi:hypothetical protein